MSRRTSPKTCFVTRSSDELVLFWSFCADLCAFCASLWLKNPFNQRNPRLKVRPKDLHSLAFSFHSLIPPPSSLTTHPWPLTCTKDFVRNYKQNMQNEPNFNPAPEMLNSCIPTSYRRNPDRTPGENEPKTNPIRTQFIAAQPLPKPQRTQSVAAQPMAKPERS